MAGFQDPIAGAGGNLLITAIQSPDFSIAGQTGWAIMKNGDAWFFNITAAGSVTSNTVIVKGSGDGMFVYEGLPAAGTLILAIASQAGTDPYGNPYSGPGMSLSYPGIGQDIIQIRPDKAAMLIYAA